jgi:bacteriocin-like protein
LDVEVQKKYGESKMTEIKSFNEISYDELMTVNGGGIGAVVVFVVKNVAKGILVGAASWGTQRALDGLADDGDSSGSSGSY